MIIAIGAWLYTIGKGTGSPMSAENDARNIDNRGEAAPPKRGLLRRAGCGLILVFWFALLLTPGALLYLAANGEIRLWHREIPQPHAHPLLLISLISETKDRGLRLENSTIASHSGADDAICVETLVRFLLWQSSSGSQDARYCDCYERESTDAAWRASQSYIGACGASD